MTDSGESGNDVAADATRWAGILHDAKSVSAQDNERFAVWVMKSPLHMEHFLCAVAERDDALQGFEPPGICTLGQLIDLECGPVTDKELAALNATKEPAVSSDGTYAIRKSRAPRAVVSRSAAAKSARTGLIWWATAAVAVCFLIASGLWQWSGVSALRNPACMPVATVEGGVMPVRLSDGSTVSAGTGSVVSVCFSKTVREIRLLQGAADFDVAHEAERPFRVTVLAGSVQALGTRFRVSLIAGDVYASVLEGRVRMTGNVPRSVVEIGAGQRGRLTAEGRAELAGNDDDQTTAPKEARTGPQEIEGTLAELVELFNGQNRTPKFIVAGRACEYRIRLFTDVSDPGSFLHVLRTQPGLIAISRDDVVRIFDRRDRALAPGSLGSCRRQRSVPPDRTPRGAPVVSGGDAHAELRRRGMA
jgi:ferric-dicitrate binding protein FerR (iron transport regulator)